MAVIDNLSGRRRWLTFSLRTLFVALTALAIACWMAMPTPPPPRWDDKHRDPLFDATQIWRQGGDYFKPVGAENDFEIVDEIVELYDMALEVEFAGIDGETGRFLNELGFTLKPVTQFGCVRGITPYEDALENAIDHGSPELQLQALAILLRARAPSSVPLQWQALQKLRNSQEHPRWQPLLKEWQACFDARTIEREIQKAPPLDDKRLSDRHLYEWSIRAAGFIGDDQAIARLAQLSQSTDLATSLAAEQSLEDFAGPKAEQALAACLSGWQCDASSRAADALLQRNRQLLVKTLLAAEPPEDCRYERGLFLARLGEAAAVPILCATVPNYQLIDDEMFQYIALLARPEDREIVAALPGRVRADQRKSATKAAREYQARMGFTPSPPPEEVGSSDDDPFENSDRSH